MIPLPGGLISRRDRRVAVGLLSGALPFDGMMLTRVATGFSSTACTSTFRRRAARRVQLPVRRNRVDPRGPRPTSPPTARTRRLERQRARRVAPKVIADAAARPSTGAATCGSAQWVIVPPDVCSRTCPTCGTTCSPASTTSASSARRRRTLPAAEPGERPQRGRVERRTGGRDAHGAACRSPRGRVPTTAPQCTVPMRSCATRPDVCTPHARRAADRERRGVGGDRERAL